MANRRERRRQQAMEKRRGIAGGGDAGPERKTVASLLDHMVEGNELGSIVGCDFAGGDLVPELRRALHELEAATGRPCLCYAGNVVKNVPGAAIDNSDHLPFNEMVALVPPDQKDADVLLVTSGGSAEQVIQFVNALRPRFGSVDFLIPYQAFSAGTLWALSGDRIWMDERGCLGPVDPQVETRSGRFVPAQSILALLSTLQSEGEKRLAEGAEVPWAHVLIIESMDPLELGEALSKSSYVVNLAAEFLAKHKFKAWTVHSSSGRPVTDAERSARALECAQALCSHERWKAHGHAITRDVLWSEIKIRIDHPDDALQRAMRRFWALLHWAFDKGTVQKLLLSENYVYVRHGQEVPQHPSC